MSDTGLAIVTAPIPNENQQQSHQDKVSIITDNMSIAHKVAITKPTTLPLSPALAQSTNQSNHELMGQNITAPKQPVTPIKSTPISLSDSQSPHMVTSNLSLEKEVDDELKGDPSLQTGDKIGTVSSGGSQESLILDTAAEGQANAIKNDDELPSKKPAKFEETIIDGFSICAFNSWEDLQDELNERIAADLTRERAAEKERQDSEKVIKKRKHKSKPKIPHAADDSNSCSQSSNKEEKSKKSRKTGDGAKSKKGSNGHPSTSGHVEEHSKKHKSSNKTEITASVREASRTDRLIDGETSQTPKKVKREGEMRHDGNNIDNQLDSSSRSNINRQSDSNTSQSPQVHNRSETQSRTNTSVLASDLLKDPSQPIPCSPYRNSHLNRMYDVTSSIPQPMQTSLPQTGAQMNHTKTQQQQPQQHSQSQSQSHIRHGSPAQQLPSNYPPKPSLIPGLPQYQGNAQAPIYPPPSYNFPTASQSQSFYHHSLHNMPPPPPNHYLYHPPGTSVHPTNSHSQIPSHLNIRSQSNHSQNSQAQQQYQHHHHHHQQPPAPHLQPPPPPAPPFGMYSPHIGHTQQTQESSMVASMSMSSLPTPYGSPYIVTDTTISRQTSIIPPAPPTALEQAAASSAAIRFGHHPNMLHSMSAYNPANAAAAAAAAASVAAQSHHQNHQTSLYQSPFPPERSFMDLARSYAESGGHLANYHSMMQSSYPAPTSSVTANPYSLDRWPKVAFEQHQRAVSRYNSFYPNSMPMLPDRTGFGSSNLRPPPFPAGLFPPPF